jgi:ABC-2 type transport system permease protein
MYSLLTKEIRSFLSSILGYVVIGVFLLIIALFMWVLPGEQNVFMNGEAKLDALFEVGPWVFLLLIPAITMRSFSEEKNTGTIELLLTKPLTDFKIIFAKYMAGFILVFLALIPTLIFFLSIGYMGAPQWNIDTGGTWGSYIGLLFLGGGFVSIGLFASAITDNQVVAFIVAMLLCLTCYMGFEMISWMEAFGRFDFFLVKLGIYEHYQAVSKGALDSRDLVYFVSLIAFFLLLTKTVLSGRKG